MKIIKINTYCISLSYNRVGRPTSALFVIQTWNIPGIFGLLLVWYSDNFAQLKEKENMRKKTKIF